MVGCFMGGYVTDCYLVWTNNFLEPRLDFWQLLRGCKGADRQILLPLYRTKLAVSTRTVVFVLSLANLLLVLLHIYTSVLILVLNSKEKSVKAFSQKGQTVVLSRKT